MFYVVQKREQQVIKDYYDTLEEAKRTATSIYHSYCVPYNLNEAQKCYRDCRYRPKFVEVGYGEEK